MPKFVIVDPRATQHDGRPYLSGTSMIRDQSLKDAIHLSETQTFKNELWVDRKAAPT
jgi:hypothetical protein